MIDIVPLLNLNQHDLRTTASSLNYPSNACFRFTFFKGKETQKDLIDYIKQRAEKTGTYLIKNSGGHGNRSK